MALYVGLMSLLVSFAIMIETGNGLPFIAVFVIIVIVLNTNEKRS